MREPVDSIFERDPSALRLHEAADQVPRMRHDEQVAFLSDVEAHGVLEPLVITPEGVILDGRHRWEAAKVLKLDAVPVREVNLTTVEQVEYIFRAALLRRHLNDDQRAVLAARMREPLSQAAKEERARAGGIAKAARQAADGELSTDVPPDDTCLSLDAADKQKADTRAEVAQQFNVSQNKVRQATELEREAPALAAQVLSGDKSLREAQRERERTEQAALNEVLDRAGIMQQPKVIQATIRRKFTDASTTLLDLEPDEVADAVKRDEALLWVNDCREWCNRLERALTSPALGVIQGGRS